MHKIAKSNIVIPRQEKKKREVDLSGAGMVSLVYLPRRETLLYKESWQMNDRACVIFSVCQLTFKRVTLTCPDNNLDALMSKGWVLTSIL